MKVQACLPNIEDLFDTIRGAKFFSKLDLKSSYHQVHVCEEDGPKMAINTPFGQYQSRVMGFGLMNAPASFMAPMNDVLRLFLRKCVIVFLDNILVFSNSWQEHLKHRDDILTTSEGADLFCKKCPFGVVEVKFLGYIVNGANISPDPYKLSAVNEWQVPTSVNEVRQFLGFTSYFRRFIRDCSSMSRPSEELTGKYAWFRWDCSQQQAFCKLRNTLLNAPVLGLVDLSREFRVFSDASDQANGAVLLQPDDHGDWQPIAFTSRR